MHVIEGGQPNSSEPFVCNLRALVKGRTVAGQRMVEVEASVEAEDSEGDLITQKALLDSAKSFLDNGFLDLDHYGEIGHVLGIPNPMSWIIGRPMEVIDGGGGRTLVRGVINTHPGGHNPDRNKADAFWDTLVCTPPVLWRASVYGIMGSDTIDCRQEPVDGGPARFLVRSFDWRSLAFTRNPINDSIKSYARIISAKSHVEGLMKSRPLGSSLPGWGPEKMAGWVDAPSRPSMDDVSRMGNCPTCGGLRDSPSLPLWRGHFAKCQGMEAGDADVYAHAAMYNHLTKNGAAMLPMLRGVPAIEGPGNEDFAPRPAKHKRAGV